MTPRAHLIDVHMGYGHARAAYALRDLAGGKIITANRYPGIPSADRERWGRAQRFYETVSRLKPIPVLGTLAFGVMDSFQQIPPFYPRRNLSSPSLALRQTYVFLKKGFGRDLIDRLRTDPLPLVTTFPTSAFMADFYDYPGEIYCVTTDADIARHWAPLRPAQSRVKYFAANGRCKERLLLYGVRADHIFLTGFPLPKELVGGYPDTTVREDLFRRLCRLDPHRIFLDRYEKTLRAVCGPDGSCRRASNGPPTLTFSVGGAGAQKKLGAVILRSLAPAIRAGRIRLAIFSGTRKAVAAYFHAHARQAGLTRWLGSGVLIPAHPDFSSYFFDFQKFLRETDILFSKPSELSFYAGLGLPILMAPPIGSQEVFNSVWLQQVGAGVPMGDPRFIHEWIFDWIASGALARMAWNGYAEAPTHGAYRIEEVVLGKRSEIHPLPLMV